MYKVNKLSYSSNGTGMGQLSQQLSTLIATAATSDIIKDKAWQLKIGCIRLVLCIEYKLVHSRKVSTVQIIAG